MGIYDYKISQLKLMLAAEKYKTNGGDGANIAHWNGTAKPINIDAEALTALIKHYQKREKNNK